MSCLGNIIWIILGGLVSAVSYLLLGVVWCITLIGIPFGLQAFKFAGLVLAPFGKNVSSDFGKHPIANVIWLIFGGFAVALSHFIVGIVFCVTIIGIPFGLQSFKLGKLACCPFGATIK